MCGGGGGRKLNTELSKSQTQMHICCVVSKHSRKNEALFVGFSIGIPLRELQCP